MNTFLRRFLVVAAVAGLAVAGNFLYAQPKKSDDDKKKGADVEVPMTKRAKISPRAMSAEAAKLIGKMQEQLKRVIKLQQVARKQKDVIKLNCVNDKLLQIKQLLNIAEAARTNLTEAIANDNEDGRYHQFSQVKIASQKVNVLVGEAEACVGDELVFLGPTQVDVTRPPIVDDPTDDDPFDVLDTPGVERPAFASPYL